MNHLILLYYVVSIAIGTANIILYLFFLIKYKNPTSFAYFIFLLLLFLYVINHSMYFYFNSITYMLTKNLIYFFNFNYVFLNSVLAFLIPLIIILLINKKQQLVLRQILFNFSIIILTGIILTILVVSLKISTPLIEKLIYASGLLLIISIIYTIIYAILKIPKTASFLKKVIYTSIILFFIFFPLFLIDLHWFFFQDKTKIIPKVFNFLGLFWLIWSITSIYYGFQFLNRYSDLTGNFTIPEEFLKKYDISEREKEIIKLVLEGYTNKEISDRLFLSTGTVKNYIYNIFQKLNISNRIQIIRKVNEFNISKEKN